MSISNSIKAIIFDMDGTLVNSIPFHKESWLIFLKNHNMDLRPEEFQSRNRGNIVEMMRQFFGEDTTEETIRILGDEKERLYQDLYREHIKEIEGLTQFLGKITNQGIKTALATMGDTRNIDFILDNLNIRSYFHTITGGHEITRGKPDPEIYELCLKKLNLERKDCIVIEDSPVGIISAKRAGLKVIGITTSCSSEELKDQGCFHTIPDYRNLDILEYM
jgi:HAD superfamily hydrolase (TIGR01509 family)